MDRAKEAKERLERLTAAASEHLAAMRQYENEAGFAAPEDLEPVSELLTAWQAIGAGLATEGWESVAEGYVMLGNGLRRAGWMR